jgi:hypothetical protein
MESAIQYALLRHPQVAIRTIQRGVIRDDHTSSSRNIEMKRGAWTSAIAGGPGATVTGSSDGSTNASLLLVRDGRGRALLLRRNGWFLRLAAKTLAYSLDRRLAEGSVPEKSPLLAARAQQLVARQHRDFLAERWAALVSGGTGSLAPSTKRVALNRAALVSCETTIGEIVRQLRSAAPIGAQGVARVNDLLSDGCGPLFDPGRAKELRAMLRGAEECLRRDVSSPAAELG